MKIMQVIPAIDLRGGHCVRLRQGDFDQETVFGDDPAAMAARWESEGAARIHLVDLDGAKAGRPVNVEAVERIVRRVGVPCQLGGGIARRGDDRRLARRRAGSCRRRHAGAARSGLVRPDGRALIPAGCCWGWTRATAGSPPRAGSMSRASRRSTLARQFDALPLAGIIYTDIARDGTLEGPNLEAIAALAAVVRTPVIASGGVGELEDLERLAALPIAGCIVGRALYEGRFSLAEAIRQARRFTRPDRLRPRSTLEFAVIGIPVRSESGVGSN